MSTLYRPRLVPNAPSTLHLSRPLSTTVVKLHEGPFPVLQQQCKQRDTEAPLVTYKQLFDQWDKGLGKASDEWMWCWDRACQGSTPEYYLRYLPPPPWIQLPKHLRNPYVFADTPYSRSFYSAYIRTVLNT